MHNRFRMDWRQAFLLLTVLTLSSCAAAKRGDVRGKVIYGGRPVIYGSVVLIGSGDMPITGRINTDGTYAVENVPAGTVRVAVVSPDPAANRRLAAMQKLLLEKRTPKTPPQSPMSKPMDPEVDHCKWFPLPKQYELADTSGIATSIHEGDNTFDIELK